eukprot:TRINITY_DN36995_c0_g1_i1.p2 TRINITY_DN36995_c0_g1~~TRINITY_DN36995_c0_g1_i1.p2  ORF type:complete len:101 (+),score=38.36 TRINITY_DN36995_c0_g1_i1:96-398(+)
MKGLGRLAAFFLAASLLPAEAALPPWWILNGVKPAGEPKDMGSWTMIEFSKEQQQQFFIDAKGDPTDEDSFKAALKSFQASKSKAKTAAKDPEDKQPILL